MTTIEIRAREEELIQEIDSDLSLLESALKYVRKLKQSKTKAPCQYSVEELKERLRKGRQAAKTGAYKTTSEMRGNISKIK
jgi:anaerobic ribonucleoside-triphosphate reductase